ncbi:MAG: redoxin domain-containing protein [Pirellulaceae bacterium]|nr:redoxin domain-containing protein [Pirellulaceae bacterium]
MLPFRMIAVGLLAVHATMSLQLPTATAQPTLDIGLKAPPINVQYWISDGGGKFKPVQEFEPGKVYVIEFWATWCPPCVASMPHLAKLQRSYADHGVQIVSISDEEQSTVQEFLKQPVPEGITRALKKEGDQSKSDEPPAAADPPAKLTFGELTAGYCLTTDPDQSVYRDFMEASEEGGIPTAFIVGKDGVVEWIGHPMELDEPLAQVVAGKWDRQALIQKRAEQRAIQAAITEIYQKLQAGQTEPALKELDELIARTKDTSTQVELRILQLELLVQLHPQRAVATLQKITAQQMEAEVLNRIASSVIELTQEADQEAPVELLTAAIEAAEKAVKLSPNNGMILDTLARLLYLSDHLQRAIEVQTQAVALSPGSKELREFLNAMKQELSETVEK